MTTTPRRGGATGAATGAPTAGDELAERGRVSRYAASSDTSDYYVVVRRAGPDTWSYHVDERHRFGLNAYVGGSHYVSAADGGQPRARALANALWTHLRDRHPGRTPLFPHYPTGR